MNARYINIRTAEYGTLRAPNFDGRTGLFLFDGYGNTGLAIYWDDNGNPVMEWIHK